MVSSGCVDCSGILAACRRPARPRSASGSVAGSGELARPRGPRGHEYYYVEGDGQLPAGTHQVRMEFAYDGGELARGGDVTLYVDGEQVGKGRVEQTEPLVFSADETLDIGGETGSPVTSDYSTRRFSGQVNWVEIDVDKDAEDVDHYIEPEELLAIAMAIQ